MNQREVNAIAGRLSLRAPQTESLGKRASATRRTASSTSSVIAHGGRTAVFD